MFTSQEGVRGPAELTVRRTADDDVQDRQVYLSLDGEDWVTLLYAEQRQPVAAGSVAAHGQGAAGA